MHARACINFLCGPPEVRRPGAVPGPHCLSFPVLPWNFVHIQPPPPSTNVRLGPGRSNFHTHIPQSPLIHVHSQSRARGRASEARCSTNALQAGKARFFLQGQWVSTLQLFFSLITPIIRWHSPSRLAGAGLWGAVRLAVALGRGGAGTLCVLKLCWRGLGG